MGDKTSGALWLLSGFLLAFFIFQGITNPDFFVNVYSTIDDENSLPGGTQNIPLDPEVQYGSYWVTLDLTPDTIPVGSQATGYITSNIPNGGCVIAYNTGSSWQHYKNVMLDSYGTYSETQTLSTIGVARFRAVCCDADMNCKVSNEDILTVV